jgi:hypothetical protein
VRPRLRKIYITQMRMGDALQDLGVSLKAAEIDTAEK